MRLDKGIPFSAMPFLDRDRTLFARVATRRDTGFGALIGAGSNSISSSAHQLFRVARTGIPRVFISPPEVYSSIVQPDNPSRLQLAEIPDVKNWQSERTRLPADITNTPAEL